MTYNILPKLIQSPQETEAQLQQSNMKYTNKNINTTNLEGKNSKLYVIYQMYTKVHIQLLLYG